MRRRVAVLISGRGSNMVALARATERQDYPAEISLVLANRPDAPGLRRARELGIEARPIDHRQFPRDRQAHETAIHAALVAARIDLVCLAGYMRILTPFLVGAWRGRMLNIHPSLLPAFPGLHTHARALAAGVRLHGCSVHLVTEQMDQGSILAQAAVPVLHDDDENTLADRVLASEHIIYPAALHAFISGNPGAELPANARFINPVVADPPPE